MLLTIGALVVSLVSCTHTMTSSDPVDPSYASSSVSSVAVDDSGSLDTDSIVIASCSEDECSVTLGGTDSLVRIFGTTISFVGTQDGRATIRVGDQDVSCAEAESVTTGPISLTCTRVGDDIVEFTARPR